jgi:uncharacterized protein
MKKRFVFVIVVLVAAGVYAVAIEPFWIETTHSYQPANVQRPIKIAHLSDLHTTRMGFRERRVLAILNKERPDVIVVTGDNFTASPRSHAATQALLGQLRAPLGIWVVRGNWENWRPVADEAEFYRSTGVHFLNNEGQPLNKDIWIAGLDDPWSGQAQMAAALTNAPRQMYRLVLFHSPRLFSSAAGQFDLALAGHTHGGQLRLPWIGPLWLPGGCGPYVSGWYTAKGSQMYVSRGIGTSILPVRFLARPEVAILALIPVKSWTEPPTESQWPDETP